MLHPLVLVLWLALTAGLIEGSIQLIQSGRAWLSRSLANRQIGETRGARDR